MRTRYFYKLSLNCGNLFLHVLARQQNLVNPQIISYLCFITDLNPVHTNKENIFKSGLTKEG